MNIIRSQTLNIQARATRDTNGGEPYIFRPMEGEWI